MSRPDGFLARGALAAFLSLGTVLAGSACSTDTLEPQIDALDRAERRWAENAPSHYAYTYRNVCFCGLADIRVEVDAGVVVAAELADGEAGPAPVEGYTMEEQFQRLRDAFDRDPHFARTEFDPVLGYPVDVWFDFDEHADDEEWGLQISDFTTDFTTLP